MFKKVTKLLIALAIIIPTVASPAVTYADETYVDETREAVYELLEAIESVIVPERVNIAESLNTLERGEVIGVDASVVPYTTITITVSWTQEQVDAFNALLATNHDIYEIASSALDDAFETLMDASGELSSQLWDLTANFPELLEMFDAISVIWNEVDAISEESGLSALMDEIVVLQSALDELELDDPTFIELEEQLAALWEQWHQLWDELQEVFAPLWEQLDLLDEQIDEFYNEFSQYFGEILEQLAALDAKWELLAEMAETFENLVDEANGILPLIEANNLTFEEAVLLVEANTDAFWALVLNIHALMGTTPPDRPGGETPPPEGETSPPEDETTPPPEGETTPPPEGETTPPSSSPPGGGTPPPGGSNNAGGGNNMLPQTGAATINTATIGLALTYIGAITAAVNKNKNKRK